ncbi:MAG: zinc-binding alcohol dehydrogenase family protein [Prevotellaceae bacterium]|jgi:2-desacetyl-2-hydroxyethyl bacteriochlorophyllide A dehydrogenase|nr:zinc-binding alcohol dehydrogenase family protein [Prevotellaceae bacterium]
MKVVRIAKPGELNIVEAAMPKPAAGEALLKVMYCGICGSDLQTYTGNQPFADYPRIPGHEFSAEIIEIPTNSKGLKTGMTVTANPYFCCGKCYSCRRGVVNCCQDNKTMGVQRDGAFAEYITMPIERIVDGMGLSAQTLALIEPFSIGYHGVNRGEVAHNDNVLVIGAGPIGLFAAISAKLKGANVYVADVLDIRLQTAMALGVNGVVNSKTSDLQASVKELTQSNGMDVVVECVGQPETFLAAQEAVCFHGKIVLIGNGKREVTFNQSAIIKKEMSIYGSRNSVNEFAPLISLVKLTEGSRMDISKMVSGVFDFTNVKDAFDALLKNDGSWAKVLVKFG